MSTSPENKQCQVTFVQQSAHQPSSVCRYKTSSLMGLCFGARGQKSSTSGDDGVAWPAVGLRTAAAHTGQVFYCLLSSERWFSNSVVVVCFKNLRYTWLELVCAFIVKVCRTGADSVSSIITC